MSHLEDVHIEFLGAQAWLTVLVALAFLATLYYYYRRTTPPLSSAWRWILGFLRGIALVGICLALLQPVVSFRSTTVQKKRVAVLLDRSASMLRPVSSSETTPRLKAAEELLNGPSLQFLRESLEFTYYAFAESLDTDRGGIHLAGKKTNPGLAWRQLDQLSAINPFDYVLFVSDGRVTEGEDMADLAAISRRPVLAVAVGDTVLSRDISLDDVRYDDVVYAGRQTEIGGVISQKGEFSGKLRLRLYDRQRILAENSIDPPGIGKTGTYPLAFTPQEPGRLILDLKISGNQPEDNEANNSQKISLRVLKSRTRILIYSSSLNQEFAFLNRFLRNRADCEVVTVIDAVGGDRLGERFPTTQEQLNSFDLLVLVDPDLTRIGSHFDRIHSYLADRGGGVLLLMGEKYAASAVGQRLEKLFPLAVSSARGRTPEYGQFHLAPDQRMIFHPALRLAETRDEIIRLWASQPPFTLLVAIDSVRSSGAALGYIEDGSARRKVPVMAVNRIGAGKILASAVSPLWHWAFHPLSIGRDTKPYRDFFDSAMRWLTLGDESERIAFGPVKPVFEAGEPVLFTGVIRDEGFRPIENASGELVIESETGDRHQVRVLPDPQKPGHYRAQADVLPAGQYTYRTELIAEELKLGRFEGRLAVDDVDRETARPDVDWSLMARVASRSGGAFASWRDPTGLAQAVDTARTIIEENHERRVWDNLVLLLVVIGALTAEWFIRKSRQLL